MGQLYIHELEASLELALVLLSLALDIQLYDIYLLAMGHFSETAGLLDTRSPSMLSTSILCSPCFSYIHA